VTNDDGVVPIDAKRKRTASPPVDGARALDDIAAYVGRYVVFPDHHCLPAVALWIAHTYAVKAFYVTPRLVLDSAEPGSGKTRVLELLAFLCFRPKMTISTTTAALYRRIADQVLTVLMDEADAIFGKVTTPQNEDLRALLNSGYKRGATVDRCVGDGKSMKVQEFPVFAPVALAGLAGKMPATITTRAVTIHMRRRAPGETVDSFRERDAERDTQPLVKQLARWVGSVAAKLADARPDMPKGVVDRSAEIWEPLLAIADQAGGDWPKLAREACTHFVVGAEPVHSSLGVRLLADLRDLYDVTGTDRMPTVEILQELHKLDEAPWGDLWGKPIDARRVASEMHKYGVSPTSFKVDDGRTAKGYVTYPTTNNVGLHDAWLRYLPPRSGVTGNPRNPGDPAGQTVTEQLTVTDGSVTGQFAVTAPTREVTAVTPVTDHTRCASCGGPMTVLDPSQTTHPGCG